MGMALLNTRHTPLFVAVTAVTILFASNVHSARILLLPAYSRCTSFGILGESLEKLGHTVYAYIPYHLEPKTCLNEQRIHIIKYGNDSHDSQHIDTQETSSGTPGFLDSLMILQSTSAEHCPPILNDELGFQQLNETKFDLAVVDASYSSKCFMLIPYKLEIPYVSFASVYTWFDTGKPFIPQMESFYWFGEMTIIRRSVNVVTLMLAPFVIPSFVVGESEAMFAPELSFFEYVSLTRNSLLFIQNDDEILSGPTLVMPNTITTGGLSTRSPQPLPREMDGFCKSSKYGVIVVAFGSRFMIPDSLIKVMIDTFSNFLYHVVVDTSIDFHLPNVLTRARIPQNDLLGHEKTKLFISHCGRNDVYEAIYHAVPVICMPRSLDQIYIASRLEELGIGINLDVGIPSNSEFSKALSSALLDARFQTNSKHISSVYRNLHPESGGDVAAQAIDHVITFGGGHLRPQSLDLSLAAFLMFDMFAFFIVVIFIGVVTGFCMCLWGIFIAAGVWDLKWLV